MNIKYVISVDFYAMVDNTPMAFEQIENEIKSAECIEIMYDNRWSREEVERAFDELRPDFVEYYNRAKCLTF